MKVRKLRSHCDMRNYFVIAKSVSVCVTRMRNVLYTNNSKKGAEGNRKGRGGNGGWHDGGKHDERARSYKGVIINGPVSQQNRNRESRDHHGKGKDKMFVEADSKWVKVADRGHKRNSTYRGNSRGDGEASHYRNTRREEPRHDTQEGRTRLSSDQTRVHNVQNMPREEAKEEGNIKDDGEGDVKLMEEDLMDQPSQKFQEELAKTQATGAETVSDPNDAEKGLQEVQGLLGEKLVSPEDEDHVMEMDEIKAHLLEHGIDMDAADDLPDFSEEETEEAIMAYDEEAQPQEEKEQLLTGDGDDAAVADLGKKKTTRKRLFKPEANTAGSTKMSIASALVSPRKRAAAKPSIRRGDNNKQQESKGTSFPKPGHQNA